MRVDVSGPKHRSSRAIWATAPRGTPPGEDEGEGQAVIEKVVTGGQAGADQGALRAARTAGIATGGFAPQGWVTEAGAAPWLGEFDLVECEISGYPARTEANVRSCDAVLWFGDPTAPGGKLTLEWCHRAGKLSMVIPLGGHGAAIGRRAVPGPVPAREGRDGRGQQGIESPGDRRAGRAVPG
jgi:hypothetical protein